MNKLGMLAKLDIYLNRRLLSTFKDYSVLKLFTGLPIAALNVWKLMVRIAMKNAIKTSFKKSLDSKVTICPTDAPRTFQIPISLIRCWAAKVLRPNKPRQVIMIPIITRLLNTF